MCKGGWILRSLFLVTHLGKYIAFHISDQLQPLPWVSLAGVELVDPTEEEEKYWRPPVDDPRFHVPEKHHELWNYNEEPAFVCTPKICIHQGRCCSLQGCRLALWVLENLILN